MRSSSDEFEESAWEAALGAVAAKLSGARKVGVIAGGHLTTEDAFAVSRLARKVIRTPHVDSRIQDEGAPYDLAVDAFGVAGSTATMNDLESARTIVWAGPDPKESLPVLYLRLRKAVIDGGAKLIVVSPRQVSIDAIATHVVRCEAGGEADALVGLTSERRTPPEVAGDIGDPVVVCWGPISPGRDETAVFGAALALASDRNAKLLVCPPHAGSQGLIDMGVLPTLEAGYEAAKEPGMDTRAMLEAAAAGELDALLLVGADVIGDFPDTDLATRALEGNAYTVVIELFPTETARHADVVLPSSAYAERAGTFTNLERRLQKLEPLLAAPGSAEDAWRILGWMARALGADWAWSSVEDVWSDITKEVPTHAGVDLERISQNMPPSSLNYESGFTQHASDQTVAGPGAGYPKGHRSGSPFQTGQNWPLSWELRAFEAKQRPGFVPDVPETPTGTGSGHRLPGGVKKRAETREQGTFALLTGRLLYDSGTMVSKTTALRHLARKPFVAMSPGDAEAAGLGHGDEVVVSADGYEVRATLRIDDVASGAVFVPYDQPGLKAAGLMRGRDARVRVTRA
jgi:NADH-quinone oxidoreductase subunit G